MYICKKLPILELRIILTQLFPPQREDKVAFWQLWTKKQPQRKLRLALNTRKSYPFSFQLLSLILFTGNYLYAIQFLKKIKNSITYRKHLKEIKSHE